MLPIYVLLLFIKTINSVPYAKDYFFYSEEIFINLKKKQKQKQTKKHIAFCPSVCSEMSASPYLNMKFLTPLKMVSNIDSDITTSTVKLFPFYSNVLFHCHRTDHVCESTSCVRFKIVTSRAYKYFKVERLLTDPGH